MNKIFERFQGFHYPTTPPPFNSPPLHNFTTSPLHHSTTQLFHHHSTIHHSSTTNHSYTPSPLATTNRHCHSPVVEFSEWHLTSTTVPCRILVVLSEAYKMGVHVTSVEKERVNEKKEKERMKEKKRKRVRKRERKRG